MKPWKWDLKKKPGALILFPYKLNGDWVFDDARVGLYQDPFIAGMPAILDFLVKDAKVKNPDDGFSLILTPGPFYNQKGPSWQHKLTLAQKRQPGAGMLYKLDGQPMWGWICPDMYLYLDDAPDTFYVKATDLPPVGAPSWARPQQQGAVASL